VCVIRLGSEFGRGAKKLHESFAGGFACPLPEKVGRDFHHSNFFGDRCRDPLVQRHAIFFREPLGNLLDGEGKLQWIGSFAHGFTFFSRSPGRSSEILNRSAGPAKSATLQVTSASARPLKMNFDRLDQRCGIKVQDESADARLIPSNISGLHV
jgi:hypothetical protein